MYWSNLPNPQAVVGASIWNATWMNHTCLLYTSHHEEKITLEDLAEIEHLSTYYISHMMKDCLGLNFREFLSFSRVEFSEMKMCIRDSYYTYLIMAVDKTYDANEDVLLSSIMSLKEL